MSASADGKIENKGLLARTATYTSKKARRAQTKVSLISAHHLQLKDILKLNNYFIIYFIYNLFILFYNRSNYNKQGIIKIQSLNLPLKIFLNVNFQITLLC